MDGQNGTPSDRKESQLLLPLNYVNVDIDVELGVMARKKPPSSMTLDIVNGFVKVAE